MKGLQTILKYDPLISKLELTVLREAYEHLSAIQKSNLKTEI